MRVTQDWVPAFAGVSGIWPLHPRDFHMQQRGPAGADFLGAAPDGGGHVGRIDHLFRVGAKRFGDFAKLDPGGDSASNSLVMLASPSG